MIKSDSKIKLNFSLSLLSDIGEEQVIDSNFGSELVDLQLGSGDMLPGFEAVLLGLKAGDAVEKEIKAVDAFGLVNEANHQRIPRKSFKQDMALSKGLVVSFADASGAELPGVVNDLDENYVTIDFNHPLAGKNILFKVFIDEIVL